MKPLYVYYRTSIFFLIFLQTILPFFAKAQLASEHPMLEACAANVLKSYNISSPSFLCSEPNTNGYLFSIEGQGVSAGYYILKPGSNPLLVEYNDGTFRLQLDAIMQSDISKEYLIEMEGSAKTMGNPQAGFTPAMNSCAGVNTSEWIFYNNFTMTLTGLQDNAGQSFTFLSPQDNKHTFQIGYGANIWQPTLGSGLWFDNANTVGGTATIKGDLQMTLSPTQCCKTNNCVPFIIAKNKSF